MSHFRETWGTDCAQVANVPQDASCTPSFGQEQWPARAAWQAKIQKSIDFMRDHLAERMQVGALAAQANVSSSYFFALFKRETGYAPIDYLIRLRMHRACNLLDTTRLSIKEIAHTLGYDDAFYFSRLFKCVTSIAPTEYRGAPPVIKERISRDLLPEERMSEGMPGTGNQSPRFFRTPAHD